MSGIAIEWERGGRARIVESDGAQVVVESEIAAAPGTPLAGRALPEVAEDATPTRYEIKVRGCRKIADAPLRFRIEGRFVNLSAAERAQLLAQLQRA